MNKKLLSDNSICSDSADNPNSGEDQKKIMESLVKQIDIEQFTDQRSSGKVVGSKMKKSSLLKIINSPEFEKKLLQEKQQINPVAPSDFIPNNVPHD